MLLVDELFFFITLRNIEKKVKTKANVATIVKSPVIVIHALYEDAYLV